MGGGGGLMEVGLSRGAVAAVLREAERRPRPVLQVAGAPRLLGPPTAPRRYGVVLSDGAASLRGVLLAPLDRLVTAGALRSGTVVRVLDYIFSSSVHTQRLVAIIQLEILQTECALIGSPISYEANATQPDGVSCSGGLGTRPSFIPGSKQAVDDSSISARADRVMDCQQFGGYYGLMPPQGTIDVRMQQLSLDECQNEMFAVTTTGGAFGSPVIAHGSPVRPSYLVAPPMSMAPSRVAMNESAPCRITSVAALNPYQATWMIKARVTAKTDIRNFKSARGPGAVFSFDLFDAQGGEIRATCFNSHAGQYFDLIEVGKVYLISKGSLKPAQKKFNPLNHEYEILIGPRTSIEICSDDDNSIPRKQCNFRWISEIENMESRDTVDLIGIVTSVGPCATIMHKDGKETQNRTLQLKDLSGWSVEISLWGKFCDAEGQQLQFLCGSGSNPILALKGGLVIDFSGRSVATISSTQLEVNPDLPEAERLRQWYVSEGKTAPCISLSRELSSTRNYVQKTIAQIKDENLGRSEKPDLITVRAVISYVNADTFCYPACRLEINGKPCYKKVRNNGDGTWYCDKCAQSSGNCEYKFLLTCQIKDHTGTTYATGFQEAGEAIFGHTAQELLVIRDEEQARFTEIMQGALSPEYLFKMRISEQAFNDEYRVRCSIVGAEKMDAARNDCLLDEIDRVSKDGLCYTPEVGSGNLKAVPIMQASSNANGVGGAGYAQS